MTYDEALAERVRAALLTVPEIDEKKMFSGVAFMVSGQMCCGVLKDELIVKVGAHGWDDLIAQPQVRPFDFTGRPMVGMVYVGGSGIATDEALQEWIRRGVTFVQENPRQAKRRANRKR